MKEEKDIRINTNRSWKDTAYLYHQLWQSAQKQADRWEALVELLQLLQTEVKK